MKKQIPALIAALLITGIVAGVMFLTSLNAYFNKSGVAVASNAAAISQISQTTDIQKVQIAQLQGRVQEYQKREQQYEAMLQQDQLQLQQNQMQLQQFKSFLLALQQRGIIRIQNDGSVVLTGG